MKMEICLRIPTIFWIDGRQLLNVHFVSDVRQIEVHRDEPLVPGPSHFEVEIAIAKLKIINHQVATKLRQN
jgi:hypothetical protein